MKRFTLFLYFFLTMALFSHLHSSAEEPSFTEPDFAYPQSVTLSARAVLDNPESSPKACIRALLELAQATRRIEPDSIKVIPGMIGRYASEGRFSAAERALLLLLEAQYTEQVFNSVRWHDNPEVEPLPDDMLQWSSGQFARRIEALCDRACTLALSDNAPLSDFKGIVEAPESSKAYIPDLSAFAVQQSIEALDSFGDNRGVSDFCKDLVTRSLSCVEPGTAPWFRLACSKLSLENARADEYLALYRKYSGDEASLYALEQYLLCLNVDFAPTLNDDVAAQRNSERRQLIDILEQALARFPNYSRKAVFSNYLARLRTPAINYSVPNLCAPGDSIDVEVSYCFAKTVTATLYLYPEKLNSYRAKLPSESAVVTRITEPCTEENGRMTLKLKVPTSGRYLVVCHTGKTADKNYYYDDVVWCTPFLPVELSGCARDAVLSLDYHTGAPVKGVSVSRRNGNGKRNSMGTTDSDGLLRFKPLSKTDWNENLVFAFNGIEYSFDGRIRSGNFSSEKLKTDRYLFNIFTDRVLYRPGDTVQWAAAVARQRAGSDSIAVRTKRKVKVTLYDANYQTVDTVGVCTDSLGRVSGNFVVPADRLSGSWRIYVECDGNSSAKNINVSEFRMPVFEAEFTDVRRDSPAPGSVTLSGNAKTFSGMPVAGAKVSIEINGMTLWRFFSPERVLGTVECVTDAEGNFSVVADSAMLAAEFDANERYTRFSAVATVTSSAGETACATRNFGIGKPYDIFVETSGGNHDSSQPYVFTPKAIDGSGKEASIAVEWSLVAENGPKSGDTLLSGNGITGKAVEADVKQLPAGTYKLVAAPVDSALADPSSYISCVTFYNEQRNDLPPNAELLYVPVTSYRPDARGKANVLVGVNADKAFVYTALRRGDNLEKISRHSLGRGFHRLATDFGTRADDSQLIVFAVLNGKQVSRSVTPDYPAEAAPQIIAESFRDRLVPGSKETWRFRFADGKGKGIADAAVVATMYNKALDNIARGTFGSSWVPYTPSYSLNLRTMNYKLLSDSYSVHPSTEAVKPIEWPLFRFLEDMRMRKMYYSMARTAVTNGAMDFEEDVDYSQSIESDMVGMGFSPEAASGSADEEVSAEVSESETFEYRPSEVMQAFWKPNLLTDSDGNTVIEFTVPEANTTWQFHAFAWNVSGVTAGYKAEALANKPVMVQPNLPRFLRRGDKAHVLATVYNNSTDSAEVATTIEIFDIATGRTVKSETKRNVLAANASAQVGIDIETPSDAVAVGYRVRSQAGGFADGEQTFIPVLEASTVVVESTEFYFNPGDTTPRTIDVDNSGDATVTLQYCQNPLWTVVKAMRGISANYGGTTTSLTSKLFSALAAKHIAETNPAIVEAITQWRDNPSEQALTSMLSRNADLKTLLLDRTPWVEAAADNSARMAALTSLLSPEAVKTAISETVADLKKLQSSDGGFRWGSWSRESSEWTTESFLMTMAIAHSLDMLPADNRSLSEMIESARTFLQTRITSRRDVKTDVPLALIEGLMPGKVSPAVDIIIRNTVADIARNRKRHSLIDKAYDVLILNANGRRQAAGEVLESIRQYGVIRPDMGMCFPSVSDMRVYATVMQAFTVMNAPASEIDAIRQWVIVQAQASDDFGVLNPDYIIASLLLGGPVGMTSTSANVPVSINGKPLHVENRESASGYFSQQLSLAPGKNTITVTPAGTTPSYGSVVSVGTRPQSQIAARPGRDISIEKRLLALRNGVWTPSETFALGERVKVELVVRARRDMDYVAITDQRSAALEPVDRLAGGAYSGGLWYYLDPRDTETCIFVDRLPSGTYVVSYDTTASCAGSFCNGIAGIQSQYAPELTAHSGAGSISVE